LDKERLIGEIGFILRGFSHFAPISGLSPLPGKKEKWPETGRKGEDLFDVEKVW